mmetsp:Transcript_24679/g.38392  ORF Transcript_24679/g.38392 Transcript_24679/m.38392 type:complete len:393 (-) Transcript_24679:193-1371(-)
MGCFGSRFDKRNSNAGDLNTVWMNFVGGEAHDDDKCPCDKAIFGYAGDTKEPGDVFKVKGLTAEDEESTTKIIKETFKAVQDHLKWLEDEFGTPQDGKDTKVANKYTLKEAHEQLQAVIAHFKEKTGITFEEEKKEEAEGEGEKKEEEEAMMEGGDEGEKEGEEEKPAAMEKPDHYKDDSAAYDGWANFPALLLRNCIVNPYFGDLVKANLIAWEFNYGNDEPKKDFTGAAGLLSHAVNTGEGDEKEIWVSGFVGELDFESLKGIAEAKGPIMFPGPLAGWDSQETALGEIAGAESNGSTVKAVYHVKTKVVSAVVCRHFVCRLHATVDKHEEKDGVHHFDLTAVSEEAMTVEKWKEEKDKPKEEPAAAAEEEKKEDEEEKKEGEGDMAAAE